MKRTLRDVWHAVSRPDAYREFMNYRKRNLIFHVLLLVFTSLLLTVIVPGAGFLASGGFGRILKEEVPDFKVSEEGFWIEEPVEIDEYNVFVHADSDVVLKDIEDFHGQYGTYDNVIIADKEQIYIKSASMPEITARFSDMKGFSFTKEDMLSFIPVLYLAYVWVFLLACLIDFGVYFLTSLATSWIAGVIASFMGLRVGGKALFRMAIYAGTTSYLLALVLTLARMYAQINANVPQFFGYLITLGYMYFALKEYKDSAGADAAA